jgi:hypothetical protein
MKKLRLDTLTVDTFPTTAVATKLRGTVAGHNTGQCTEGYGCPDSYGGTCWMSCWDTCYCDTAPLVCG